MDLEAILCAGARPSTLGSLGREDYWPAYAKQMASDPRITEHRAQPRCWDLPNVSADDLLNRASCQIPSLPIGAQHNSPLCHTGVSDLEPELDCSWRSASSCREASLLAASGLQVCSPSESSWSPVDFAVQGIDSLHQAVGLPWWLTIVVTAAGSS